MTDKIDEVVEQILPRDLFPYDSIQKEVCYEALKAAILRGELCLPEAILAAVEKERERCERIIEAEPELPGKMPDHIFNAVKNDREAIAEMNRITIRLTKKNVLAAIRKGE